MRTGIRRHKQKKMLLTRSYMQKNARQKMPKVISNGITDDIKKHIHARGKNTNRTYNRIATFDDNLFWTQKKNTTNNQLIILR